MIVAHAHNRYPALLLIDDALRVQVNPEVPILNAPEVFRVKPNDFESLSGDLLEHYRDSIYPSRGQRVADLWYAMQVLGFVSPGARLFAVLFSAQFLAWTGLRAVQRILTNWQACESIRRSRWALTGIGIECQP